MSSKQGEGENIDHHQLLKNFYLFTDATADDLSALVEAIGEPRVCITVDIMPVGKEIVFATMGSG